MIHTVGFASLLSGLIAQSLKVIVGFLKTKRLRLARILDTGGMPSSHTSTVTTLTAGVGVASGFDSSIFSVTLIFSMYIVFEAAGLRQEVGKQARVLNELVDELRVSHRVDRARLKELVGHTWWEVMVGFVIGMLVALIAYR